MAWSIVVYGMLFAASLPSPLRAEGSGGTPPRTLVRGVQELRDYGFLVSCRLAILVLRDTEQKERVVDCWVQYAVRQQTPWRAFELFPEAPVRRFDSAKYIVVHFDGPRYVWVGKKEAGISSIHPEDYAGMLGISGSPLP